MEMIEEMYLVYTDGKEIVGVLDASYAAIKKYTVIRDDICVRASSPEEALRKVRIALKLPL